MKKKIKSISETKADLESVKGKTIRISVSRGRGKTEKVCGKVTDVYPNVFVFDSNGTPTTFALTDIICGDVKILAQKPSEKTT
jgi:uncharacterized protein Veg